MLLPNHTSPDELLNAVEREMFGTDNPGFCRKCGAERDGCEPDAEGYECYECGARAVDGAMLLLMKGYA
jgi:hypothetical protein